MSRRFIVHDSTMLLGRVVERQERRGAGRRCQYCGAFLGGKRSGTHHDRDGPSVDHVLPVSAKGSDDLENLKLACGFCNEGRAITGHCIGALACALAVIGRRPAYRDLRTWWRQTTAYSRQQEIERAMLRVGMP